MAHGLTEKELARVQELIGRIPNDLEKGIFGAMWSEHCSYKSSRAYLNRLPKESPRVLVGPGENAGAVDIGDGLCVVFKVESHNHPSYIEPFQGAATGVGGILRDVFTMGARPFATMNLLRFGSPEHPKTQQLVSGATKGLSSYGNCFGVANVASDVAFDACYDGNILVNAFAIGICKHSALQSGVAKGVGNVLIYVGAKTGRDGIHGATMASESFGDNEKAKRPTVQVGDPFKEKLLLEACLECFDKRLVVGIQDMGAAGLTSSSYEMASRAKSGIDVHLDRVPLRDLRMTPYEIMLSESQERMLLAAKREHVKEIEAIFARYNLDAVLIGEVTSKDTVDLYWNGDCVSSLRSEWLTDNAPIEHRPFSAPIESENAVHTGMPIHDVEKTIRSIFASRKKASHFEQYDSHIGLGTILSGADSDASLLRVLGTNKGITLTIGCDEKLCAVDPNEGVRRTVARQVMQLACLGSKPIGLTNCLNFGSPEDEAVMWQFVECVNGLSDAARAFDVPVVSGNVSLYNQTNEKAIYPTPTVCLVGLLERLSSVSSRHFKRSDDVVLFLGSLQTEYVSTEDFLSLKGMQRRTLERWDLLHVRKLAHRLQEAVTLDEIDTVCSVGDGGILGALIKMELDGIVFDGDKMGLCSEASMGVIVSAPKTRADRIRKHFDGFDIVELGVTKHVH